ncbi:MAG: DNA replication/repair protein RecF [Congregibacter sp.]
MQLDLLARHNVFYGDNGSGKTSLLETVHILGTGRSFRTGVPKSQISHGSDEYLVRGGLALSAGASRALAVQRDLAGEAVIKVGGEAAKSVAQLADELPLVVINSDSFELLVGPPDNRRKLMDWGVFHVEHQSRSYRQRFHRTLLQRNHLLRRDRMPGTELEAWTKDLAELGEHVAEARARFMVALEEAFDPIMSALAPEIGRVTLSYRRGWDAQRSYLDVLQRGLQSDFDQGFTQSGPQRADIKVLVDGHSAADTLSRGQQKLLICGLKLAQGRILAASGGSRVVYLVDDLPSELDQERCERVCSQLAAMEVQTLITCVSRDAIHSGWLGERGFSMFHVEHGEVERL